MTHAAAAAQPSVREILAAGQCSAACILSALKPEQCRCRCNGAWHGSALAALGLTSHPPRGEGERASAPRTSPPPSGRTQTRLGSRSR